jgi:hypothetical protein
VRQDICWCVSIHDLVGSLFDAIDVCWGASAVLPLHATNVAELCATDAASSCQLELCTFVCDYLRHVVATTPKLYNALARLASLPSKTFRQLSGLAQSGVIWAVTTAMISILADGTCLHPACRATRALQTRSDVVWDNEHRACAVAAIDSVLGCKLHGGQLKYRKLVGVHVPRHRSKRYGLSAALGGIKTLILGRAHEETLHTVRTVAMATLSGNHQHTGTSLSACDALKHHGQFLYGVSLTFGETHRWPSLSLFVRKVDHRPRSHGTSDCGHPVLDLSISLSAHRRRKVLDVGVIVCELKHEAMISVGLDLLGSEAPNKSPVGMDSGTNALGQLLVAQEGLVLFKFRLEASEGDLKIWRLVDRMLAFAVLSDKA